MSDVQSLDFKTVKTANIWRRAHNDQFLRHNTIFFIGSMSVAFLNYLYHPIISRLLDIQDFGEVQTIISLFLQMSMIFSVFTIITVNITANTENEVEKILLIRRLERIAFYIFSIFLIFLLFRLDSIKDYLQFNSTKPFIILIGLLFLNIDYSFKRALLQGEARFFEVTKIDNILAASRIILAVGLIFIGFSTIGAIGGLLLAQILSDIYVNSQVNIKTSREWHSIAGKIKSIIKQELKYGVLVLIAMSCITFLYTADVILIKHWFSPHEAGLYSGIAIIARIIFFASNSVAGVMLSTVKLKNSPQANARILAKALILVIGISGFILVIFHYFSATAVMYLMGMKYFEYSHYLSRLGILMFLASILNLLLYYFLALRNVFLAYPAILGVISAILLTYYFHADITHILNNFIYSTCLILTCLFTKLIYDKINLADSPGLQ